MPTTLKTGMILAAGFGKRMMPLTAHKPKPLLAVAGRTMLDRALDHTGFLGLEKVVVNSHYKAPAVANHLKNEPGVQVIFEEQILETGGGITGALPLLGTNPFVVLNGDIVWFEPQTLNIMAEVFSEEMDVLLMLVPLGKAKGYHGKGDFFIKTDGSLMRRGSHDEAPYVYGGAQILHPRLFEGVKVTPFSINTLWDSAMEAGRLGAVVHQGPWFHLGTPEDLRLWEKEIEDLNFKQAAGLRGIAS